jgi:hypothetical protein
LRKRHDSEKISVCEINNLSDKQQDLAKMEGEMKHIKTIIVLSLFYFVLNFSAAAQIPSTSEDYQSAGQALDTTPIVYNALYASAYSDLWHIDPNTGTFTEIGNIGYEGTDIAFDGMALYGTNFSQFLSIDPTTGAGSVIGNIGFNDVNALTIAPDGTMYAGTISGALLKIDKSTGLGTLVGYYGSGLGSSGDLAIRFDNKMYASVRRSGYYTDWLAQIDTNTGRATLLGDIGESSVYGLDFKDWSLYGVTDNGLLLEIDPETGESTQIAATGAYFWGMSTSGPALLGNITSPYDNFTTAPATIMIEATAEYPGGNRVNQVEFFVMYDGYWHSLGSDRTDPYASRWVTPLDLLSQQALLRINVIGTDNEDQVQMASYAGGVRRVNVIDSLGDPNITEVWIPTRTYLNQRSLYPDGDSKCNVSSIAMVLAMDGYIDTDYLTMANKANELAPYLLPNPGVDGECEALRSVVEDAFCSGPITHEDGWENLTNLIDAGHPVIVDSRPGAATTRGHYIVAVGYREEAGTNYIIAYDPYGQWRGRTDSYYMNQTLPTSHVGKWVLYEFEEFTGNQVYLFATIEPTDSTDAAWENLPSSLATSLTPPDQISDEPRIMVSFNGRETIYLKYLHLPALTR